MSEIAFIVAGTLVLVFLIRGSRPSRTVTVQENSGQVVAGDVHGDVVQHQSTPSSHSHPGGERRETPRWFDVTGKVLSALAALAAILGLLVD